MRSNLNLGSPRFCHDLKCFKANQEICRIIRIPELIQKDWSIMKSGSRYLIHNAVFALIYVVESTLTHSNRVNQGVQIA